MFNARGQGRRPYIAITPDISEAKEPVQVRYEIKRCYLEAVLAAGGMPIVLPYTDDPSILSAYIERCVGLVLTGGAFDVPPQMYNEAPREGLGQVKHERSDFEMRVLRAALQKNIAILGICGGMQLINVAFGGSLFQDLKIENPQAKNHEQKHARDAAEHPVDVKEGTALASAVGRGQLLVNSTHHQAVQKLGADLLISAKAPDGVIEAIESKHHRFVLGVQWHPEMLYRSIPAHLGVYRALVSKAREFRR